MPARPHLLRQPLPAAEPFSIYHIRAGLQLSIIVQLVRDVQDGRMRPRRPEEKEQDQRPRRELCFRCSSPQPLALQPCLVTFISVCGQGRTLTQQPFKFLFKKPRY